MRIVRKIVLGIITVTAILAMGATSFAQFKKPPPPPSPSNPLPAQQTIPSSGVSQPVKWPEIRPYPNIYFHASDLSQSANIEPGKVWRPVLALVTYKIQTNFAYGSCFPALANRPFFIRIEIDNVLFEEQRFTWDESAACPEGTIVTTETTRTWTASYGTHTIKVIVDSKDDIVEGPAHEANNTLIIPFEVARPDIKLPIEKNISPVIPRAR
jgi:hypothetical protein